MKRNEVKRGFLTLVFMVLMISVSFAQMTGPGDPGSGPGTGDPPIGGGAPLSGGVIILFVIGAAYGGKKVFDLWQKDSTREE